MFVSSILGTVSLNLESNLQHILSLSSILLFGKNRVHPDFKKCLGTTAVDDLIKDVLKNMGLHENKFPRLILVEMLNIVQDVYRKNITKI